MIKAINHMLYRVKELFKAILRRFNKNKAKLVDGPGEQGGNISMNKFKKLTAVDDVDLRVYEDAFKYIFDNSDIVNVAISGSYGAGKSSVIASYEKQHKEIRFMHISLTHFNPYEQDTEREEDGSENKQVDENKKELIKESVLEGKILNQLLHQIPAEDIPQTNFRVRREYKTRSIVFGVALTIILIISTMHVLFFNKWIGYVTTQNY